MITKITVGNFNFKRNYPNYIDDTDRSITKQQKKTLVDLIYARVSNSEEIERRLIEIEDYNFSDASEAINDFLFAPWR